MKFPGLRGHRVLLISESGKKPDGGRKLGELVGGPDTLVVDVRVQLKATCSGWGLYSTASIYKKCCGTLALSRERAPSSKP
jgi:hypothetical protein